MMKLSLDELIGKIKMHSEIGMIACYLGIVRGYSKFGKPIKYLRIEYNRGILIEIVNDLKRKPGIKEILVEIAEGKRQIGDWIMAVLVAGDTRQHTFLVLQQLVELIKKKVVEKEEY